MTDSRRPYIATLPDPRMPRPRFSLRALLLLPLVLAVAVGFFANRSHEQVVLGNDDYRAFYRGLGWDNGSGITGRRYYAFTIDDLPYRTWSISYSGGDYGDAVCRYPDGTLALEGECRIEFTTYEAYPLVDELRNAKSYSPDGKLAASVVNGTGRAMWFYPDGALQWEVRYDSGERTLLRHFGRDGTLRTEISSPENGKQCRERADRQGQLDARGEIPLG